MRTAVVMGCGLILAGLAFAACGGSSSETPWPIEPETQPLGPAGELGPGAAVDDRADQPDAGPRPRRHE